MTTYVAVMLRFWIWVCVDAEREKYKRVTLFSVRRDFESAKDLSEIETWANLELRKFRAMNNRIMHSDIYASWIVHQNVKE